MDICGRTGFRWRIWLKDLEPVWSPRNCKRTAVGTESCTNRHHWSACMTFSRRSFVSVGSHDFIKTSTTHPTVTVGRSVTAPCTFGVTALVGQWSEAVAIALRAALETSDCNQATDWLTNRVRISIDADSSLFWHMEGPVPQHRLLPLYNSQLSSHSPPS